MFSPTGSAPRGNATLSRGFSAWICFIASVDKMRGVPPEQHAQLFADVCEMQKNAHDADGWLDG
jgi:hypothetical protein